MFTEKDKSKAIAEITAAGASPAPAPAKSYTIATKAGYSGAKWHVREMTEAEVIAEAESIANRRGDTLLCHTDIEHEFRLFANAIDQDKISAFKAYHGIE